MTKYLFFVFIVFITTYCSANDFNIIKRGDYQLSLDSKRISAGEGILESFDIDVIDNKIPDQIFATVESGQWIYNIPSTIFVSFSDGMLDKIIEYWDVSFVQIKNGGRVLFTRTVINNDNIERESYGWSILLKCKYVKYK